MVESKEDLTLPGLSIESSLMWRSKPSQLRTWLARWKADSYLPHLFIRILKPSQRTSFETALTSSLAVIPASRFQQQDSEREQMTHDTCGPLSGDTSNQLDLFNASLKMLKATSRLDFPQSSAIWKKMVTDQRGEYLARKKLALLIRESESTSWATPNTMDYLPQRSEEALVRQATTRRKGRTRPANLREQVNPTAIKIYKNPTSWATPTCHIAKEGAYPAEFTRRTLSLTAQVAKKEKNWPTPDVAQAQKVSNRPNYGQLGLANHPDVHGKRVDREPMQKDRAGLPGQDKSNMVGKNQELFGKLNPEWVEHLMGVPTGWTDLDSWETE
jgi:hypothetical protein